jgi:hypothetical protein
VIFHVADGPPLDENGNPLPQNAFTIILGGNQALLNAFLSSLTPSASATPCKRAIVLFARIACSTRIAAIPADAFPSSQVEVMHTQFRVSQDHKLRTMLKKQSAKVDNGVRRDVSPNLVHMHVFEHFK